MENNRSGGVQHDAPTNPVSSDPQSRGSVGRYSSEEKFTSCLTMKRTV